MKKYLYTILSIFLFLNVYGQEIKFDTPGAGNPIVPGYFADPTVCKFGDTYYMYATTDGNGGGLGPSQVWISKDFVNWFIQPMNWPTTPYIWAPDVLKKDDKYYMYYCQPTCEIYCGVSETPVGPWVNIFGEDKQEAALVPNYMVKGAITLDAQTFVDDDGSIYLYWGTWGIYPDHGCGVGKLNPDMKSFSETALIPNTQAIDFFEAPFVFKRNGIYYFTYSSGSCHDDTYRVQYATSTVGPMGPFEFADNNPILATNEDGTIHGPGHHSIVTEGDDYYIVYHLHDIPQSTRGMHRQITADKMTFDEEGRINVIKAGHEGIGYLQKNTNPYPNLALGKKVKASSYYDERFKPEYATDDNNGTLWRPRTAGEEWIEIDLEKVTDITRIWTQFEYATSFYQYIIETSKDGNKWEVFADRRNNTQAGSPMMDTGKAKARYVRMTVTGNEKNGLFGAIWNIKIFNKGKDPVLADMKFEGQSETAAPKRLGLIFEINADDYSLENPVSRIVNRHNKSQGFDAVENALPVRLKDNKSAFLFNGTQEFKSDFPLSEAFVGNSPFSLLAWIYMEDVSENECIVDLTNADGELRKVALGYGKDPKAGIISHNGHYEDMGINNAEPFNKWRHLAVTFDGYMEKIYLDGELIKEKDVVLRLPKSDFVTLGKRFRGTQAFKNLLHSLSLYDIPVDAETIRSEYTKGIQNSPLLTNSTHLSDLNNISSELTVKAISPNVVKISTQLESNPYNVLFQYENLTSGAKSEWIRETEYFDISPELNKTYEYEVKAKDMFGNTMTFNKKEITVSEDDFITISDDFSTPYDFVKEGGKTDVWSGLSGFNLSEIGVEAKNGMLYLSSSHRNFQQGRDNGPFLYHEVEGDFVAEVEIIDFSGMNERKAVSFNEGGMMVMLVDPENSRRQEIIHLGAFPHYNVGNILTDLSAGWRTQYQNNKGWDLDRFLQVERSGNKFYFRTSSDGKVWKNMPNSPIIYQKENAEKVKVGVYQVTYTDNEAYVAFDNFKLWIPKP